MRWQLQSRRESTTLTGPAEQLLSGGGEGGGRYTYSIEARVGVDFLKMAKCIPPLLILMGKWHLTQAQPFPRDIFKEPLLICYNRVVRSPVSGLSVPEIVDFPLLENNLKFLLPVFCQC